MMTRLFVLLLTATLLPLGACRKRAPAVPSGPPPPPEFGSSENNLGYLNEGVRKFKELKQRAPANVEELAAAQVIARVPAPPPGFAFALDAASGLVVLKPLPGVR